MITHCTVLADISVLGGLAVLSAVALIIGELSGRGTR
jgi:hypothetical protein